MILANTRILIGSGNRGTDENGDPIGGAVDGTVPAVPASLIESTRVVLDDTTQDPRTIVWATLRASPRVASMLRVDSIVLDTYTGKTWVVEEVRNRARTMYGTRSVTFNLKTTDATPR